MLGTDSIDIVSDSKNSIQLCAFCQRTKFVGAVGGTFLRTPSDNIGIGNNSNVEEALGDIGLFGGILFAAFRLGISTFRAHLLTVMYMLPPHVIYDWSILYT